MRKILIISGSLQRGGIDHFCVNIALNAPANEFVFHYLIFEGTENTYKDLLESRGIKVYALPSPNRSYYQYFRSLLKLIKENRYNVVHSNTQFNSGFNLLISRLCRVPIRIAHAHTTEIVNGSVKKKVYEMAMRIILIHNATHYFACSQRAGYALYGEKTFKKTGIIVRNGIDVERYRFNEEKRNNIRKQLIGENGFIIGHVGNLVPVKNQDYLIRLMPKILEKKPDSILVLAGEGSSRITIEKSIKALCLEAKVILLGSIPNVGDYLNAFDVFVFPSIREGAPLALVEAQSNGLPCIVSANVPSETDITDLINRIPLDDEEAWVDRICQMQRSYDKDYAKVVYDAGYSISESYRKIYDTYLS